MSPKKLEGATTLNVRVDEALVWRVDKLALYRSRPGAMLKRSDLARLALQKGIEALEAEEEAKAKAAREAREAEARSRTPPPAPAEERRRKVVGARR